MSHDSSCSGVPADSSSEVSITTICPTPYKHHTKEAAAAAAAHSNDHLNSQQPLSAHTYAPNTFNHLHHRCHHYYRIAMIISAIVMLFTLVGMIGMMSINSNTNINGNDGNNGMVTFPIGTPTSLPFTTSSLSTPSTTTTTSAAGGAGGNVRITRRLLQQSAPTPIQLKPSSSSSSPPTNTNNNAAAAAAAAVSASAAVDGALDRLSNELADLKFAFSDEKLERLLRDLADFQQQLQHNPSIAAATPSITSSANNHHNHNNDHNNNNQSLSHPAANLESWLAEHATSDTNNNNNASDASSVSSSSDSSERGITVTVRVLVNEHFELERCLSSLLAAHYPSGAVVHLELWMDHTIGVNATNMRYDRDTAAAIQQRVLNARLYGHSFEWPYGTKRIHSHAGSEKRDWPHTWRPKPGARDEYSYFLSSDAEVSPLYYTTLVSVIKRYRHDPANIDPNMFGVCLEPYPIVLARDGVPMNKQLQQHGDEQGPFLYMLPCEGNQLIFPEHWADFLAWYSTNAIDGKNPYLGNLGIPEQWFHQGRALWMAWLVRYLYVRNSYNLHMNFPMDHSLAISHSSVLATSLSTTLTSSSLIRSEGDVEAARWQLPALTSLPRYDLCMSRSPRGVIARDEASFKQLMADRVKDNVIIMVTVNKAYRDFLYNWLCTIKRLHITNYVLYTVDQFMARELAAEGHPVYFNSVLLGRDITSNATLDYGTVKYQMLILARTHFIGRVLSMGITVLVADVDAVWMENPLPYLKSAIGDNNFLAQDDSPPPTGKGVICGGFMYLMPTDAMIKLWTRVTTMHEDIVRNGLNMGKLKNVDESEQAAMTRLIRADKSFRFAYLEASKFPNGYEYFKSKKGELLEAMVIHNNFIIGAEPKRNRFRDADLWFIDDIDTHCKAITC